MASTVNVGDVVNVHVFDKVLNGLVTSANPDGSVNVATTSAENPVDRYGHQVKYFKNVPQTPPQNVDPMQATFQATAYWTDPNPDPESDPDPESESES